MKAVIQAGGKGTRLHPYTFVLPKPLMPVGEHPVIEMLLKWLRRNDIQDVYITIGYLGHLIRAICGEGKQWGINIHYSEESKPLGTIGPLLLIKENLTETFLVLNGDLITDLDLRAFTNFHREMGGLATIAVTDQCVKLDFGVIENGDLRVSAFKEKPSFKHRVSMGIYCLEPQILDLIPEGLPFGFDNLMYAMLDRDLPVYTYAHDGCWLDIGRHEDFMRAQQAVHNYAHILE
jgi:NDP-sugar pyrophosphorylase family protein